MIDYWAGFELGLIKYWDEGLTIYFKDGVKKLTHIVTAIEVRHKVAGIYELIVDFLTV